MEMGGPKNLAHLMSNHLEKTLLIAGTPYCRAIRSQVVYKTKGSTTSLKDVSNKPMVAETESSYVKDEEIV